MRRALFLFGVLVAACATPPRITDRSTPEQAYRTFLGALARDEYDREWACMSDRLRGTLGIESSVEWADARVIAFRSVGPIARSRIRGRTGLEDGRVVLEIRLPFGYRGRVWMKPIVVLRIFERGKRAPPISLQLEAVDPAELARLLAGFEGEIRWIEHGTEWFLDDYAIGAETPGSARRSIETRK